MRACRAIQPSSTTGARGSHSWSVEGREGGHWNALASGDRLTQVRNSTVRGRNVGMQMAPEREERRVSEQENTTQWYKFGHKTIYCGRLIQQMYVTNICDEYRFN